MKKAVFTAVLYLLLAAPLIAEAYVPMITVPGGIRVPQYMTKDEILSMGGTRQSASSFVYNKVLYVIYDVRREINTPAICCSDDSPGN
jgi:hypothetical protein